MENNELAQAIFEELKAKGAEIGNASVGIIERAIDTHFDRRVLNARIELGVLLSELRKSDRDSDKALANEIRRIFVMAHGEAITNE